MPDGVSIKRNVIYAVDAGRQICREMKSLIHLADIAFAFSDIGVLWHGSGFRLGVCRSGSAYCLGT